MPVAIDSGVLYFCSPGNNREKNSWMKFKPLGLAGGILADLDFHLFVHQSF